MWIWSNNQANSAEKNEKKKTEIVYECLHIIAQFYGRKSLKFAIKANLVRFILFYVTFEPKEISIGMIFIKGTLLILFFLSNAAYSNIEKGGIEQERSSDLDLGFLTEWCGG